MFIVEEYLKLLPLCHFAGWEELRLASVNDVGGGGGGGGDKWGAYVSWQEWHEYEQ